MMNRLVSPRPGASRTLPEITDEPSSPKAIMCSLRMLAPALVPPTVTPRALRTRISFATGVPPSRVVSRSWLPPVKKMPLASSRRCSRPGSWQSRRVSKSMTVTRARAEVLEDFLVARSGLVHAARGRNHDDVRLPRRRTRARSARECGGRSPCSRRRRWERSSRESRRREFCLALIRAPPSRCT